jgi:hypothetical protein
MKYVSINREPFARQEMVRQVEHTKQECAWCGQNHKGRLFRYGILDDGISTKPCWEKDLFCNKSCRDSYNF